MEFFMSRVIFPTEHLIEAAKAMFVGGAETREALANMHTAASESLQAAITRGDVRGPLANALTAMLAMQKARDEFVFKLHDTEIYKRMERMVQGVERLVSSGQDFESALEAAFLEEVAGVSVSEINPEAAGIDQTEGGAFVDTAGAAL